MQLAVLALVFFSVLFGIFGFWLLIGQRADPRSRIEARLMGPKLVKRYELGDALAQTRDREQQKRQQRKEAIKRRAYSDIPAVDKVLRRMSWADKLDGMLIQTEMPVSVASFMMLLGVLAALGVAVSILWRRGFDPVLAILFGLMVGGAPALYVWVKVRRRVKKFNAQLPDALDLLSSSVKAGQSLNAGIQNVADEMPDPVSDEFRILSDELTFGVDFTVAMSHLMMRVATPDVRFLATALCIQKETGGNLSEVLDGLQKTIRERFRILGQVKTLTAQGRLSGLIVALLPLVLCAFLYSANPDYMRTLFEPGPGRWLMAGAVGLQVLGIVIIAKIVNIKV